ncbi:xanthotoxin 5-hydroxylase CYP82C4-like [Tasmannia lanceolata]|uniref:xanthotoxin 5-hydroxylase CYP82C4-like n=1 Tax=Tasmannia lanceolata TaxID=3420 RepID=UPI0040642A00
MEFLLHILTIAGLLGLVFFYKLGIARKTESKETVKAPPELPGGWPIIGHLHLLGGNEPVARKLGTMADKYGPAFMIRLGLNPTLVVNSSELAKECFTTNDKILATRPQSAIGKYLAYDGAMFGFTSYGAYWREIRKLATVELLSNHRLGMLEHVRATEIDICVKDLYGIWKKNDARPIKIEMKEWFETLTFNVVVMMVVGKRYFGVNVAHDALEGEARRFREAMDRFTYLAGVFVLSDALPFLKWVTNLERPVRDMKRFAKELDSLLSTWLEEHRQKRLSGEAKGELDFIDVMLAVVNDTGLSKYHDNDTIIKATSMSVILGAVDTTTVTLTWALSLLLNNPHALKKAQDELDIHIGKERQVDESDIKNLVYLQAIIKETFRMYPAGPLLAPHLASQDCNVGGYHIPAGTWVMANVWKIQQDPRVWSDPSEFRPERFLTSHVGVDVRGQHFDLIPFGSGRRSCPGISFALQIVQLTLARLLHSFNIGTPSNMAVDMTEGLGLTLPKVTPLEVLLTPRLPLKLYE